MIKTRMTKFVKMLISAVVAALVLIVIYSIALGGLYAIVVGIEKAKEWISTVEWDVVFEIVIVVMAAGWVLVSWYKMAESIYTRLTRNPVSDPPFIQSTMPTAPGRYRVTVDKPVVDKYKEYIGDGAVIELSASIDEESVKWLAEAYGITRWDKV